MHLGKNKTWELCNKKHITTQCYFFITLNNRKARVMIDYQEKHDVKTHLVFRNVFTVVSAASELTKLTISAKMEGSRKCEAVLVVHC